jgi:hypothetical protein
VAVDDTLFRRTGRKVHAACWAYDGSRQVTKGQQKLSRGNTFVVAAIVVTLPFLDRPIALPVLAQAESCGRWPPARSRTVQPGRILPQPRAHGPFRAERLTFSIGQKGRNHLRTRDNIGKLAVPRCAIFARPRR